MVAFVRLSYNWEKCFEKKNINFLTDKKFQKSLRKRNKIFDKLSRNLLQYNSVTHINTRGMVTGIIFENKEIATNVVKKCISKGILPVCTFKNAIKLGPPLTITTGAIKEAMEVIRESIKEAESEQNCA